MFYFMSLMGSTYVEVLWLKAAAMEEAAASIHPSIQSRSHSRHLDGCRNDIQRWCRKSRVHSASSGTSSQPLSSIRSAYRFSVVGDVFTGAVSIREASEAFNKIAWKDSGRKMMKTPADEACHCGLPTSNLNA